MPYLGRWLVSQSMTIYLQTLGPTTADATDADSLPTYRIYHDVTSSPLASGTFALMDSTNTNGFYATAFLLSSTHGFSASGNYCVYKQMTVCSVSAAQIDTFQIFISA